MGKSHHVIANPKLVLRARKYIYLTECGCRMSEEIDGPVCPSWLHLTTPYGFELEP